MCAKLPILYSSLICIREMGVIKKQVGFIFFLDFGEVISEIMTAIKIYIASTTETDSMNDIMTTLEIYITNWTGQEFHTFLYLHFLCSSFWRDFLHSFMISSIPIDYK